MHFIVLGLLTAVAYLVVAVRLLNWGRVIRLRAWLDVILTFIVPFGLNFGTLTGAMVAVMAGLWFSLATLIAGFFIKPVPLMPRRPHQGSRIQPTVRRD